MEMLAEEDEDVVIEGSELHRALVNVGYTDFELAPVNQKNSSSRKSVSRSTRARLGRLGNLLFESWRRVASFFRYAPNASRVSSVQLRTILGVECLLDDHRELVSSFMENHSKRLSNCRFTERSVYPMCCATIAIGSAMLASDKTRWMCVATIAGAFAAYREFKDIRAMESLKDAARLQNELYRAYKKTLGILMKFYRSESDGEKARTAFSASDARRLKFLRPLSESLWTSMENMCRVYRLAGSSISGILSEKGRGCGRNENWEALVTEGKITYDYLRRLFYVYILAQSDTLELLAIAWHVNAQGGNRGRASLSRLTRIHENVCGSLRRERNRMVALVIEYENCKRKTSERKYRIGAASKWRDLCVNLDLLSRKLERIYDEIAFILGAIEKRTDEGTTEIGIELTTRIHGIYLEMNESMNLAEFNESSLARIVQRGRGSAASPIPEVEPYATRVDRAIERDSEPQIIDEVFEEYTSEKETKSLCEEREEEEEEEEEAAAAKLDRLLAKNFMSELKDALVEKSKSMTEREARALLRKYPKEQSNTEESSQPTITICGEMTGSRAPVPIPRPRNVDNVSRPASPPPPPPPPPPPALLSSFPKIESSKNAAFSIGLVNLGSGKMPAFVTCEEEFVGSGENSEDEGESCDFAS